jgi:hypothetical protein
MANEREWNDISINLLRKLQAQGLSVQEIGRHLQQSQVSVTQQLVLMGLPIKLVEPRRHR